jgi:hypothetical protein
MLLGAMLRHVSLAGLLAMMGGMVRVSGCGVSVVRGLLVVSAFVMFGRFGMVLRGVSMMFGGVLVVFSCF